MRVDYPLELLLAIAQLARSTFFYYLRCRPDKDAALRERIIQIKQKHPSYGYRRVTATLTGVNHKRVQRLMKEMGLQATLRRRKKYSSYQGEIGKIAPNLLRRDFKANQPNEKWVTDITEFKAKDGQKLYFSPILDTFNNEIIAFGLSKSPNWLLVKGMLQEAIKTLPESANPILHSDQGWHYQMRAYQQILQRKGMSQSMSRKGNCLDNAAMESFFGRLKIECFYGKTFESVDEIEQTVKNYIRYYNEERIQLKLKGLSPIQYRIQSLN